MTRLQLASRRGIKLVLTLAVTGAALAAQARTGPNVDVNVAIGGVIQPGVYGRVEVGTRPPPPVVYPQPVIITQPVIVQQPVVVQPQIVVLQPPIVVTQSPIYLHVPPGHSKHWSRHCREYNACNQPVYFVRNDSRVYSRHGQMHDRH